MKSKMLEQRFPIKKKRNKFLGIYRDSKHFIIITNKQTNKKPDDHFVFSESLIFIIFFAKLRTFLTIPINKIIQIVLPGSRLE